MRSILRTGMTVLLAAAILSAGEYWQQKVIYDIQATLVDSIHTVTGHEDMTYINNSPDTLEYIWMHLWPNAYRDTTTALARQKFRQGSTKMYFAPDSAFGYINISNVKADGETVNWHFRSADTADVALFPLDRHLAPGDSVRFSMDMEIRVPQVFSRMGHKGNHYEITQWYPKPAVYDIEGWHPMSYLDQGEFYSEWGDYLVSITLPENYRVAATGVLQEDPETAWRDSLAALGNSWLDSLELKGKKKLEGLKTLGIYEPSSSDRMKTVTWKQENVHDFAWFADKRFVITKDTLQLKSGRTVSLWTYALPQNLRNYRYSNEFIKQSVSWFSDWFMEYPYDHVTVVDGDFSAGGGMEYPMITLINNVGMSFVMELTIMHEVGHNWFYGLSATNERLRPWMDEGLNSYAEARYWAKKYPDNNTFAAHKDSSRLWGLLDYFLKNADKQTTDELLYHMSAVQRLDQPTDLSSEEYSPMNYGAVVYKKGALITATLHGYLGDSLMTACWHEYFRRWAYKHPRPGDMRAVFEEVSGEDLGWFFDGMLREIGPIDYALGDHPTVKDEDGFRTDVEILNIGDSAPPVPVNLKGPDKNDELTVWVRPQGEKKTFSMHSSFPVESVELDPDRFLPEVYRGNNRDSRGLSLRLYSIDLNPSGRYNIAAFPFTWYNEVDGIHPGIILSHGGALALETHWFTKVLWGFETNTPYFTAGMSRSFFPYAGRENSYTSRATGNRFYSSLKLKRTSIDKDIMFTDNRSTFGMEWSVQDIRALDELNDGEIYEFLDTTVWDQGVFTSAAFRWGSLHKETLGNRSWDIELKAGYWADNGIFGRLSGEWYFRKRFSREGSFRMTFFGAVHAGSTPQQQHFYIASDIDPEFDRKTILARNDEWYAPGQFLAYTAPYTLYGFMVPDAGADSRGIALAKFSVNIPHAEVLTVHGGTAVYALEDGSLPVFGSLSLGVAGGPVHLIYTPFRIQAGDFQTDWSRVQIALDLTTFGIKLGP